ncbi:2-dehydro-3-deoxygalactonokinase [uncultured Ramlibacter sp.]|uniref:2-dehydro-3-deoxygalactonokinase n=1 Tax=uncultured Ramlibacter sp. TaxID=260755 RepID=UPI002616EF63|nr:2-dehydro-3-deoxygalactonokinase [uncultured Ramlibacter sp.]
MSEPLVAVDWGTTSLRAALLDGDGRVLAEHASAQGILAVPPGQFASVLAAACAQWERPAGQLVLMSGMVGSRQGWQEAPYCPCPAGFAEVAAQLAWVQDAPPSLRVAIAPGLSCEQDGVPDVMRGEEVQVFGALDLLGLDGGLFVLPGTHSKWVRVQGRRIAHFATFMTGEVYALLRKHSILARTMAQADGALDTQAFTRGVEHARAAGNLLHAAFSARTLSLFGRIQEAALPSYLSGLVIGEELRSQSLDAAQGPVVVIGSDALTARYELALQCLGVRAQTVGPQATWRGLWSIAQTLEQA